MGAYNSVSFFEKTGLSEAEIKASPFIIYDSKTKIISFLPTAKIGENYKKIMKSISEPKLSKEESLNIVRQYTNHETGYCTVINLILAADGDVIINHSNYIKQLNCCIKSFAYLYPVKVKEIFRGLWFTEIEFQNYKKNEFIYIPSFISTSKSTQKFYNFNTLMKILLPNKPKKGFEVGLECSKYAKEEEEVLLACYTKFKVISTKRNFDFNGKMLEYYIELELINQSDYEIDRGSLLQIISLF